MAQQTLQDHVAGKVEGEAKYAVLMRSRISTTRRSVTTSRPRASAWRPISEPGASSPARRARSVCSTP
jgi:hypothetical protein